MAVGPSGRGEAMEDRTVYLRNAIVLAVADGRVSDEERALIERLRQRLEVSDKEFRKLLADVRSHPNRVSLPQDPSEAARTVELLAEFAAADGTVSARERGLVRRAGEKLGLPPSRIDSILNQASGAELADPSQVEQRIRELYARWAQWDDARRRAKLQELADMGRGVAVPLLRVLESYKSPDGEPNALSLKARVAEKLGELGDDRAVYYLAQQVNIGQQEDEITNAELRQAAAAALGKLVRAEFRPDDEGVAAARQWWQGTGRRVYDRLAF
jgi:uncharacterized tellurite resistance protein B-like protein